MAQIQVDSMRCLRDFVAFMAISMECPIVGIVGVRLNPEMTQLVVICKREIQIQFNSVTADNMDFLCDVSKMNDA
jgi:hypothetical protein